MTKISTARNFAEKVKALPTAKKERRRAIFEMIKEMHQVAVGFGPFIHDGKNYHALYGVGATFSDQSHIELRDTEERDGAMTAWVN